MAKVGLRGVVGLPRPEHRLAVGHHRHVLEAESCTKSIRAELKNSIKGMFKYNDKTNTQICAE